MHKRKHVSTCDSCDALQEKHAYELLDVQFKLQNAQDQIVELKAQLQAQQTMMQHAQTYLAYMQHIHTVHAQQIREFPSVHELLPSSFADYVEHMKQEHPLVAVLLDNAKSVHNKR